MQSLTTPNISHALPYISIRVPFTQVSGLSYTLSHWHAITVSFPCKSHLLQGAFPAS